MARGVRTFRAVLAWACVATALAVPVAIAATSPLLAWRQPVYIAAGFAGVIGLALLLLQPLLMGSYLPGLRARLGTKAHAWIGSLLVMAVVIHVVGLYVTSPPDVIDALLFRSPTPFSFWGVIAMWAVFATALLAAFRRRLHLPNAIWRLAHTSLAVLIVVGTVIHAVLIEGTMGTVSKAVLCVLALAATGKLIVDRRTSTIARRRRSQMQLRAALSEQIDLKRRGPDS
ncbi:MAG: ferric reductase-like transmembrane domain-containing protein [Pseudomonadota bacterium]